MKCMKTPLQIGKQRELDLSSHRSFFLTPAGSAGNVAEEEETIHEPYFPTRWSEILHRLWYVLTYRI